MGVLISFFSFSIQKNYDKSSLKKFLKYLGAPDVPLSQFLEEPDSSSDNDINPGEKEENGQQNPGEDEDAQNPGEDEDGQNQGEDEDDQNPGDEEDDQLNPGEKEND